MPTGVASDRFKMKKDLSYIILNGAAAVFAAAVIICISVSLTVLAKPIYYADVEILEIPETSGFSREECVDNYNALIDYNLLGGEDELIFPTLPMSEHGKIHFEEVKDIFVVMQIIAITGAAAVIIYIIYVCRRGIRRRGISWMRYTGILVLAIALAVGISMLIDWQWTFETMHGLLFDNDYWLFDPYEDPVIRILPDEFFFHCGAAIVILSAGQMAGLEVCYRRARKKAAQ